MTSRKNLTLGLCVSATLILSGCGGSGGDGFGISGNAGAAEASNAGLAAAYLSGRRALESGDLGSAAGQFDQALAADPENQELRTQLFLLHLSSGAFEDALNVARQLAELETRPDDAILLLAFEAFQAGDLGDTEAFFDQVTGQGVNGLVMPFLRAWLAFSQGNTENALTILDDDAGANGLTIVRDYHKAAMLQLLGREDDAAQLMAEVVPAGEPSPTRLMIQKVAIAQSSGSLDEANAFLAEQAKVDGDNIIRETISELLDSGETIQPPISNAAEGMSDALLSLARALADQRGGAQALLMAQLGHYVAPRLNDLRIFIAELQLRESRYEMAQTTLSEINSDPVFGYEANLLEANVLRRMENYEEATQLLENLATARPLRSDALVALGNMHSANRDYDLSASALTRAVERIDVVNPTHWRLFYSRGIAFERTDRWPLAESDFKKALELYPDQPFVLNYLGYSWVDQGLNLDVAKGMLRKAVELRPEDGFIVDSLGWAHFRLQEYQDAVLHLERAVELEPGDPVINDHLGDAYWRVGREREARFQWERAKLFEPEEDVLAAIIDKLESGLSDNQEPG